VTNKSYEYITDTDALKACLADLEGCKEVALDTETYQDPTKPTTPYGFIDPYTNKIRLLQLKSRNTRPYLIDIKYFDDNELQELKQFLSSPDVTWVGANLRFDYKFIKVNLGVQLEKLWDTVIASQLIGHACGTNFGKARGHSLKATLKDFLGISVSKDEQISYWGGNLTEEQLNYAATDVLHVLDLKEKLLKSLEAGYPDGFDMATATQDEMDLIPVLGDIEINGIGFDQDMFKLVQAAASAAIPTLVERICKSFNISIQRGFMGIQPTVNLDSPKQLLEMLAKNGIEVESTEADVLEEAAKVYPKLEDLLEYKKLQRALKFPYSDWVHPITNRVHPSYNQLGAGTSRLSSYDFNTQQVPKLLLKIPDKLVNTDKHSKYLDKKASEKAGKPVYTISYRACFVASEGNCIITSDYSGQELCVVAAVSGDKSMCHILSQPEKLPDGSKNPEADLHSIVGAEMFGVPVAEVMAGATNAKGEKYRDNSKIVSFGKIYGKEAPGFAKDWGVSEVEARKFLKGYDRKFPELKNYLDTVGTRGEATRLSVFPENFPERRYRFLNDNGRSDKGAVSRAAKNTPIQGTSAVMIKKALVRLWKEMKNTDCKLIMTVHDEISSESSEETAEAWRVHIKTSMEDVANYFLRGLVPGRSDSKKGKTWLDTH
jgi:DNA polymerase I-like protein with 3'-5' exonuclease and polymerase domains